MAGPLEGLRVLEIAHERTAFAGKLLADAGADVRLLEPPSGCAQRGHAPFVGDRPAPEGSLSFWHYNTSKRGITLDLATPRGIELARELIARVDVVLEGEDPGRLEALGLDATEELSDRPAIVWVSITPFGRSAPRAAEPATDLTLLAGGGPAWSCGYDDHSLPPVRGGGNQAYHTGAHYAVIALLAALLERERSGVGQLVDVDIHAACNVTILSRIGHDEEVTAIYGAGRDAVMLIASKLPANEFFREAQERGIPVGVIYAPEEVLDDPHFRARGFPVEVDHPQLGRAVTYPGAPYRFLRTPWRISRRAPRLGEHNADIYAELGLGIDALAALHGQGVL